MKKRMGCLLASAVVGWGSWCAAQAPELIAYQGKLLQSNSLVNAEVYVLARIFTNQAGGSYVYENVNVVRVVDGVYSFYLGSNTTFGSLTEAVRQPEAWLELAINGTTLSPRERLAAAAYALAAQERDPLWAAVSNALQAQVAADRQNRIGGDAALSNSLDVLTAVDSLQDALAAQLMADKLDRSAFGVATNHLWAAMGTESAGRAGADAALSNRVQGLAFYGANRSVLGVGATNEADDSCVVRGTLYLDGGTGVLYRAGLGAGAWSVKAFAIDHPLDPEHKILRHYCIEGPSVWNLYAGNAVLQDGRAEVLLPDYYEALNKAGSEIYSLTPVGGRAEVWVEEELQGRRFVIAGSPDVKVSWTVKALRNDPACLMDLQQRPVEQLKSSLSTEKSPSEPSLNTEATR